MVQRLARGPFKAEIRVRFPLALPNLHSFPAEFCSQLKEKHTCFSGSIHAILKLRPARKDRLLHRCHRTVCCRRASFLPQNPESPQNAAANSVGHPSFRKRMARPVVAYGRKYG